MTGAVFAKTNSNKTSTPTVINADTINSNKNKSSLSAKGNVQLTRDIYKVVADEVVYNSLENKIYLKSKTKLTDINNNNIFADEAVVSDDLLYGEFKNAGIILNNGISIISPKIIKENDDIYSISNSNYYFCPNENLNIDLPYEEIVKEIKKNKKQLFSISSKSSQINKEKNKFYLKHVFVKFLGVPIFYIPYIATSRPFSDNVSGFSSPSINKDSNYGYSILIPYKIFMENESVFTIKPKIYEGGNFVLGTEFCSVPNKNISLLTNLDYIYDKNKSQNILNDNSITEKDEDAHKNDRFLFEMELNGIHNNDIIYKADINLISDRYLLRDYYNDYTKTLQSNIDITKLNKNSYLNFDIVSFQEIREKEYSIKFKQIHAVPSINYGYNSDIIYVNGKSLQFELFSGARDIVNDNNTGYTNVKITTKLSYKQNILGATFESNVLFDADSYNYFKHSYDIEKHNYRIKPELELKLTTLMYLLDNLLIKPKVQYFLSDSKNIDYVNVDSYDSEININNIFTDNRYSGNDLVENGSRINYGVESSLYTDFGDFNFIIAQAYRNKIDDKNIIKNFENRFSNILTQLYYSYGDTFISFSETINNKTNNIDRQELLLESKIKQLTFGTTFVKLLEYKPNSYEIKNKEKQLNFNMSYEFTDHFFIDLEIDKNLEYHKTTLFKTALRYEDGCFRIQASVRKNGYIDSIEDDNFSFNVNLRLKSTW
ncbi:MAG: LPS-assembly protein LptD [Rickettsiales bacterium]|nr:LPS-assembly protein LptD [Rickettsiales bacterium]